MKSVIVAFLMGLALGLGVGFFSHLSSDAVGVIVGLVVMAFVAGLFMLALIWAMGRRGQVQTPEAARQGQGQPGMPGNIFILPGNSQMMPWQPGHSETPQLMPAPRNFRMVGDEWRDEEA